MGKIKQISSGEVLDSVIAGEDVYMLKGIKEETTVEEIKQAEAYIVVENYDDRDERVSDEADGNGKNEGPDAHICDEDSEESRQNNDDAEVAGDEKHSEREPEEIMNALPPDEPEKYPAKKKKKAKKPVAPRSNAVDHGKIVACYRAGRSVQWIADEVGCSYPTVVNHLEKEGIYKARK